MLFCSQFAEEKSQKTDCLTLNAFLLSCGCLCFVSRPNSEYGISGNTYSFSYKNRKTDR